MNFNDFINKDSQPEGIEIDGTFQCQTCHQYVDTALIIANKKILKWTCSQGHDSFIEEFSI